MFSIRKNNNNLLRKINEILNHYNLKDIENN